MLHAVSANGLVGRVNGIRFNVGQSVTADSDVSAVSKLTCVSCVSGECNRGCLAMFSIGTPFAAFHIVVLHIHMLDE
jgi:hypothetical protein